MHYVVSLSEFNNIHKSYMRKKHKNYELNCKRQCSIDYSIIYNILLFFIKHNAARVYLQLRSEQ